MNDTFDVVVLTNRDPMILVLFYFLYYFMFKSILDSSLKPVDLIC